jgi:hypothetical protein
VFGRAVGGYRVRVVSELRPEGSSVPHRRSAAAKSTIEYSIHSDGCIDVDVSLQLASSLPVLPRVGLAMRLAPELRDMAWFGRGPHENYPDRKASALHDVPTTSTHRAMCPLYFMSGGLGWLARWLRCI